jgi:hypothetical protein
MAIGLYVTGSRVTRSDGVLDEVLAWLRENHALTLCASEHGHDDRGRPCLLVSFHPGAEDVVLTLREDGGLDASAVTSPAGPGYHAHVCEVLHGLGAHFDVDWAPEDPRGETGDETGFFHTKNRPALEDAMARWLAALAGRVRTLRAEGREAIGFSLPEEHTYLFDGSVATPLGPRDDAWLARTHADGRAGFDVFPWAEPGTGAGYLLGRALVRMWRDVRWRRPGDEDEAETLAEVTALLEAAHTADPRRAYPWREWAELLALLGQESLLATRAQLRAETAPPAAPIGYRRGEVRARLSGGWTIDLPGSLAERWDDAQTWCAWERGRTVWFTSLRVAETGPASADDTLAGLPPLEGEVQEHRTPGRVGIAAFGRGTTDGVELAQLRAYMAAPGSAAVLTVCFEDDADRDLALTLWRSLRFAPPQDSR